MFFIAFLSKINSKKYLPEALNTTKKHNMRQMRNSS